MYSHEQIVDGAVLCQIVFILCFLISAFFIAANFYAGFNAVATGIVYAVFCALTYFGLRHTISRTLFGAILGGAFILVFVSLESAVFWGQYSQCETYKGSEAGAIAGVVCYQQSAMRSVCTFSVFMFLSYLVLIGILMKFKNEILGSAPLNEGYAVVMTSESLDAEKGGSGSK